MSVALRQASAKAPAAASVRTYRVRRANLTPSQDRSDVVACRLWVTVEWPSAQPGYAVTTLT